MADRTPSQWFLLGKLGRTHGLQGGLTVQSFCSPPESLFDCQPWHVQPQDDSPLLRVKSYRLQGKTWICVLENHESIEACQPWVGQPLYARREHLTNQNEPGHYWQDLYDLEVVHASIPHVFGRISFMHAGSGFDLMVIATPTGGQVIIPFHEDYVQDVDYEAGQVRVLWEPE